MSKRPEVERFKREASQSVECRAVFKFRVYRSLFWKEDVGEGVVVHEAAAVDMVSDAGHGARG